MTIRELAKRAGVSHATVSRALRDSPRISAPVRKKIQQLAVEHGYQPHPLVSKLMSQLPHVKSISRATLAVVTNSGPVWRRHAFLREIYSGLETRAGELGYRIEEFSLPDYDMSCRRLSDVLYARGMEGVLIMPLVHSPGHLSLKWERFASVAIGRSLVLPGLHRVSFNHNQNMLLALRKLRRLGYRRIALALRHDLRARVGDAYVAEYGLYQRLLPPAQTIPIYEGNELDPREVARWLRANQADALLCNYSPTESQLQAQGIEIPGKLGYASLDRFHAPAEVGGIDQHPREVGAAAVDMLTSQLNRNELGIPTIPKLMLVPGSWAEKGTLRRQAEVRKRRPAKPLAKPVPQPTRRKRRSPVAHPGI